MTSITTEIESLFRTLGDFLDWDIAGVEAL